MISIPKIYFSTNLKKNATLITNGTLNSYALGKNKREYLEHLSPMSVNTGL